MLNRFLRIDAVFIFERDHTLKSTCAVQCIRPAIFFAMFLVFFGGDMFARVSAVRAFIDAGIGRVLAFAPEKGLRMNLLITFFALVKYRDCR
jgi:hypothetical protein